MLKTACGTEDFNTDECELREFIFSKLEMVVKYRGAVKIDTPVFELFKTVQNIYGEEFNKLVYKLDEDKTEPLIMRYDLTLPFIRYCAMNGIKKGKYYRFGKVYRKDDPQIKKGRLREFNQFDLDIISPNSKFYDLEILETLDSCLYELIGDSFTIKINFRDDVYKMLTDASVKNEDLKKVCSALDKLNKKTWDEIKTELSEKNQSDDVIDNIKKMLDSKKETEQVKNLMDELKMLGIEKKFAYEPTLIRGLDYYTGLIFEVEYNDKSVMESSISAGGRYDNMLGLMSKSGTVPCVGLSIGVERIAVIMKHNKFSVNKIVPSLYVASVGDLFMERLKLTTNLRRKGISVLCSEKRKPKMKRQFDEVFDNNIEYLIIIGKDEISNGTIEIKNIKEKKQIKVNRDEFIDTIDGSNIESYMSYLFST